MNKKNEKIMKTIKFQQEILCQSLGSILNS